MTEPIDLGKTREQIRETRARSRLLVEQLRLGSLQAVERRRKLLESGEAWEWIGAWNDVVDRLRGPDRDFVSPISTAQDRRHGDNWPYWRSWNEHARLRAASRLLYDMTNQAGGILRGIRSYVIGGEGHTARAAAKKGANAPPELVDAVQEALDEFAAENLWVERQQEAFIRNHRDGEFFLRSFPQEDGMLRVRFVDPEQIGDHPNEPPEVGKYGVITDPEDLESVEGYWTAYDGNFAAGELVPTDEVLHGKVNVDSTVKRGLTDLSFDTYDTLKSAGRLIENMAEGSAIQASIAFFRQHEGSGDTQIADFASAAADFESLNPATGKTEKVERYYPGKIIDTGKNVSVVVPPFASNVQGFVSVAQAVLRAAGNKWNAPEWLISGDASNNNYSSALVAESPFRRRCEEYQGYYSRRFILVARAAVRCRCDAGRLVAGGRVWNWDEVRRIVDITVVPPRLETRDPLQQAQEDQVLLGIQVKSPQLICQERGLDYEQVTAEIEAHRERMGDEGDRLPLSVSEHICEGEEPKRKVGEVWKGDSGRYFTKNEDGRVVPASAPGGGEGEKTETIQDYLSQAKYPAARGQGRIFADAYKVTSELKSRADLVAALDPSMHGSRAAKQAEHDLARPVGAVKDAVGGGPVMEREIDRTVARVVKQVGRDTESSFREFRRIAAKGTREQLLGEIQTTMHGATVSAEGEYEGRALTTLEGRLIDAFDPSDFGDRLALRDYPMSAAAIVEKGGGIEDVRAAARKLGIETPEPEEGETPAEYAAAVDEQHVAPVREGLAAKVFVEVQEQVFGKVLVKYPPLEQGEL